MKYATDLSQTLNTDLRNSLIDIFDFQFEGYGEVKQVAHNVWSFEDHDETILYDEKSKRFYSAKKVNGFCYVKDE